MNHLTMLRGILARLRWPALIAALAPLLAPTTASAWWNQEWSYRKAITIEAAPAAAAGAQAELADVPVLVRLHDGVIRFADANADGSDLRFVAGDDKTPLRFHVEKFDNVFSLAFVWVSLPKIVPGTPTTVWMYYGNPKSGPAADARGSYDADQVLVYHFGARGTPVQDETGYANHAQSAIAGDDAGLIGTSARFDGQSVLRLPASASLAIATGASLTWSAWVKPASAGQNAVLFARHDGARALRIGLGGGVPYAAVSDDAGSERRTAAAAPLAEGWHHLALTAAAGQLQLFVDGTPGPQLAAPLPALAGPASLGADLRPGAEAPAEGFNGRIDELQISKAARPLGVIRFLAQNEGSDDKQVAFGADEQLSTWSSGYLAIILRSVTLDGWVVIGLLALMALISWTVMVSKARDLARVTRANKAFNGVFREFDGNLQSLDMSGADGSVGWTPAESASRRSALQSPLYQLYAAGVTELDKRLKPAAAGGTKPTPQLALSAQSIEAIRATLDAHLVEEAQRLNSRMVFLTIAISGGPFLGLLGTVVGVMITFAAIAAAGDVNVNAIAPGISAALVATVAGLLVAIPALFGYNYLLTRIKDATANMQVFVDAFVTRMAESHHRPVVERTVARPLVEA